MAKKPMMKVRIVIEGSVPREIWPLATLNVLLNALMYRVQKMEEELGTCEDKRELSEEMTLHVENNWEHLTLVATPKKRFHFLRELLAGRKKGKNI